MSAELDRIRKIVERRNLFHLNAGYHIVYCPVDDRRGCHNDFHASTVDEVRELVLASDVAEKFKKVNGL